MNSRQALKNGDVVLVPFPFTDLSQNKLRPALVVSTEAVHDSCNDISVVFISSVIPENPESHEYCLRDKHPEFKKTGLKKDSLFKVNKIVTIEKSLVKRRLGQIGAGLRKELVSKLKLAISL